MRSYIKKIIGKQIAGVVASQGNREPREQVYLIFRDGTHFEIFGELISCASDVHVGDVDVVVKLLEGYGHKDIKVYSAPE